MDNIKVGDMVRCITNKGYKKGPENGEIYIVTSVDSTHKTLYIGFKLSRFVPIIDVTDVTDRQIYKGTFANWPIDWFRKLPNTPASRILYGNNLTNK